MTTVYRIVFTRSADKVLRSMPRELALRIRDRLDVLAQDPYTQQSNVTKLQNRSGFRLRVGDWRVIYDIEDYKLIILVLKIGPRGEVYR
jgi:mRNA interferase RelE/StbE